MDTFRSFLQILFITFAAPCKVQLCEYTDGVHHFIPLTRKEVCM